MGEDDGVAVSHPGARPEFVDATEAGLTGVEPEAGNLPENLVLPFDTLLVRGGLGFHWLSPTREADSGCLSTRTFQHAPREPFFSPLPTKAAVIRTSGTLEGNRYPSAARMPAYE